MLTAREHDLLWGAKDERMGRALICSDETTADAPAPEECLSTLRGLDATLISAGQSG